MTQRAAGPLGVAGGSCAACRFWTDSDGTYGDCARTRANYRFRSDGDVIITGTLAIANADYDVAGYGAVLRTHANFGCVQWLPRVLHPGDQGQ